MIDYFKSKGRVKMADKSGKKKVGTRADIFQGIFGNLFERTNSLGEKETERSFVEVGATKFRSIVEGIENGKDLVKAEKTGEGVRLSIVFNGVEFYVIDSLAKDIVTAKKRILFMGEMGVRLSFWAQKGGYDDDCSTHFIGMR